MGKRVKTDSKHGKQASRKKFPLNRPEAVHGGKKYRSGLPDRNRR